MEILRRGGEGSFAVNCVKDLQGFQGKAHLFNKFE